jgi:hypothetical protein
MTKPHDDQTRPAPTAVPAAPPRRPPAAPSQWGTVTALGTARGAALDTARGTSRPTRSAKATAPQVHGSLALDHAVAREPGHALPQTPELRLVTGGSDGRPADTGNEEVQLWAARFAQAVVEVLGGDRPLPQLVRWTSARVYLEIDRRLSILTRTSDTGRRMRTIRPQVRSVHVCRPTPHSAEVSVHVRHGQRSRAIAARLEHSGDRWQCTALQLG